MQTEKLSSTTMAATTNHQSQNVFESRQQPNRERTTEEKGELIKGSRSSRTSTPQPTRSTLQKLQPTLVNAQLAKPHHH
jgi:hypothetical protein